jgi:hypothetical protein
MGLIRRRPLPDSTDVDLIVTLASVHVRNCLCMKPAELGVTKCSLIDDPWRTLGRSNNPPPEELV